MPAIYGSTIYGSGALYESAASGTTPLPHGRITKRKTTPLNQMNDVLVNRINMVAACIDLAKSAEFSPVWTGNPPLDFATDLAALETAYGETSALASQYNSATTGSADAKDMAETVLEDATFTLARALRVHFKKVGDLPNRAKVDVSITEVRRLRDQTLKTYGSEVLGLATTASGHVDAVKRGISPARIATLTAALGDFEELLAQPRQKIATRGALRRELQTRVAALMEEMRDLDDLVYQFDTTETGRRFIAAWRLARSIVDAGHGPTEEEPAPAPTVVPEAVTAPGGSTN